MRRISEKYCYSNCFVAAVLTLLLGSSHAVALDGYPYGWYDRTEDPLYSALNMSIEGANFALPYYADQPSITPYLDAASARGLEIILPLVDADVRAGNQTNIQNFVNTYDSHPALHGWYLIEEADVGNLPVQLAEDAYDTVKANSSKTVFQSFTGHSVNIGSTISYANSYDTLMMVNYPYHTGNPEFSGLETPGEPGAFAWNDSVAQLQTQMQQLGKPWWHTPQAFGQTPGKPWTNRLPTHQEKRFIVYSSVLHDAAGQTAWAHYRAESTDILVPTDPYTHSGTQWIHDVWEPIADEFAIHGKAISNGATGNVSDNQADILSETYRDPDTGDYYLVALNNKSGSENPTFTLSSLPFTATAAVPIGETSAPIGIAGNQFTDSFSNYQAHVYRLVENLTPEPPQTPQPGIAIGAYTYVTNNNVSSRIYTFDLATEAAMTTTGGFEGGSGLFDRPRGGVIGPDGNLYIASIVTSEVFRFDPTSGDFIDIFADSSDGLSSPVGITLGPDGNFYVANGNTPGGQVVKIDGATGADLGIFAGGVHGAHEYSYLVFGPDGDLYVGSPGGGGARGVFRFNGSTGVHEANIFGSETQPDALLVDNNYLYVGDGRADDPRIRRYAWATGIKDILVDDAEGDAGGLNAVSGLGFDANGDLLVSSFYSNQVLRYDIDTGAFIDVFADGIYNPTFITNYTPGLPGDFNLDGDVDAADYTVWRDGDSPDSTTAGYALWVANFGQSIASGSGADHVPEPTTLLLALLAMTAAPLRVRCG